jgi:hypothetical protein
VSPAEAAAETGSGESTAVAPSTMPATTTPTAMGYGGRSGD